MRLVDQETGEELPDTRPPREPREGGDRGPRGDRGDRGAAADRDRGPRRDGGGGRRVTAAGGGDRDRGPRGEGAATVALGASAKALSAQDRTGGDEGPAPAFAPAFLTGDDAD